MNTRVNINIPQALFERANGLVEQGMFSNFSELVREGLRKEIAEYEGFMSKDEKRLFQLLKKADQEGLLIDEKEMKKHGL